MAPLWQTGPFPVIKGQTHSSIKISRSAHNVNQTEYTVRPVLYSLGSHRQTDTQHLHLCPLFQPSFPANKQYLHIMYTPSLWEYSGFNEVFLSLPPPPTVSFKLLQLLLYLRKIHYLGKLCILVQGFLLCRNEHKHKINERVWALNWSWIVKKFVFSLYLFFCCKSLHFDHAVSTFGFVLR